MALWKGSSDKTSLRILFNNLRIFLSWLDTALVPLQHFYITSFSASNISFANLESGFIFLWEFFFFSRFPALVVSTSAPCRQQGNGTSKSVCALFHLQTAPLMPLHRLFPLPFVSLPIHSPLLSTASSRVCACFDMERRNHPAHSLCSPLTD